MLNESRSPTSSIQFSSFYRLWIKHIIFAVLTLSWSRFFTKTQLRAYMWSHTHFDGESFEYTGKGMELLKGFLKAMGFAILIYPAFFAMQLFGPEWLNILSWLVFLVFFVFFGAAGYYGALRYRLSRTNYRGIHFGLDGSAFAFGWLSLKQSALTVVTLGLYYPYALNQEYAYVTRHTRYGDTFFSYDTKRDPPFETFVLTYIFSVFTFGLSLFWFSAAMHRHVSQSTSFLDLRFSSTMSGGRLMGRTIVDYMILVFSLGFLAPLVQLRNLNYWYNTFHVSGDINFERIKQRKSNDTATSEALIEILGVE